MILKLFISLCCCIKARSQVLFILLPQCVEINKLSTDTLEDREMNELTLGGQMDGAGQKASLALFLSLRTYPTKYQSKWVEILLAI